MTDAIIIMVLAVLAAVGVRATVKHFRGEGACCGGGTSVRVKRKRLKTVVRERTLLIEGMTCVHCKERVESRLNELAGVSARVNLKEKMAFVSMDREVSDEKLRCAVENAGYRVLEIF